MKIIKVLNKFGIDIKRYPSRDLRRRKLLLDEFEITDIIDVGANFGQYGIETRSIGFRGNIYSFEPLSYAYKKLKKTSKNDNKWQVNNFALGNVPEQKSINISKKMSYVEILFIVLLLGLVLGYLYYKKKRFFLKK